jgi:hypothetical protein
LPLFDRAAKPIGLVTGVDDVRPIGDPIQDRELSHEGIIPWQFVIRRELDENPIWMYYPIRLLAAPAPVAGSL